MIHRTGLPARLQKLYGNRDRIVRADIHTFCVLRDAGIFVRTAISTK